MAFLELDLEDSFDVGRESELHSLPGGDVPGDVEAVHMHLVGHVRADREANALAARVLEPLHTAERRAAAHDDLLDRGLLWLRGLAFGRGLRAPRLPRHGFRSTV